LDLLYFDGTKNYVGQVFSKCDTRDILYSDNGNVIVPWAKATDGTIDSMIVDRMCSNRFKFTQFSTHEFKVPEPIAVANAAQPVRETGKIGDNLDAAKGKCASLGFIAKTPKFGECVLKLSQ